MSGLHMAINIFTLPFGKCYEHHPPPTNLSISENMTHVHLGKNHQNSTLPLLHLHKVTYSPKKLFNTSQEKPCLKQSLSNESFYSVHPP